jgi:hypothetical protein
MLTVSNTANNLLAQVAVQATTEVSLIQDDHVVEEFAADGADHAFHEGIPPILEIWSMPSQEINALFPAGRGAKRSARAFVDFLIDDLKELASPALRGSQEG